MPSLHMCHKDDSSGQYTPEERQTIMQEERWRTVKIGISKEALKENFKFLNQAVTTRSGAQGIPLLTTTGIYGPIYKDEEVCLVQGAHNVVEKSHKNENKRPLLEELKHLKKHNQAPLDGKALAVKAKWISADEGGALPSAGKSSNVFGATGTLIINNQSLYFPVVNMTDEDFHTTLGYYGAKLITTNKPFTMGFDKTLFGIEYDTRNPGYLQDYIMDPLGGGGLFVETHPFPHIWLPNPQTEEEKATNICRILLGRVIPDKASENTKINSHENKCAHIAPNPKKPKYHFTAFEIPTKDFAIAVDECTIHNDSFCNGKQVVFLAATDADTVALRESTPYKNLRISNWEKKASKK